MSRPGRPGSGAKTPMISTESLVGRTAPPVSKEQTFDYFDCFGYCSYGPNH